MSLSHDMMLWLINPYDVNDVSCTCTIMLTELNLINEQWIERKNQSRLSIVCGYVFSIGLSCLSLTAKSPVLNSNHFSDIFRGQQVFLIFNKFWWYFNKELRQLAHFSFYLCSKRFIWHNYSWLQCIFRDSIGECWRLPNWSGHWPKTFNWKLDALNEDVVFNSSCADGVFDSNT